MKNKEFHKWFNRNASRLTLDEQSYYDKAEQGWIACKKEILKLLKDESLGVGNYGLDGKIKGVIHRIEVIDKIRKL